MTAAAIIVAAGSGQRFGNEGKCFALTHGFPMAWWSLAAAAEATSIDEIVLVCGAHSQTAAQSLISLFASTKPVTITLGGLRRQDSTLAGVHATSAQATVVAIHDAARPLVTGDLFDRVVAAAREFGGAVAAVPVSDTIKRVADDFVRETIPRDELVSVQTPQAFRKSLLVDAFASAAESGTTVTDEASLIESLGQPVRIVPGHTGNIKVTYPSDLILVEALLRERSR